LVEPLKKPVSNGGDWLHVLATTRLGENELHGAHRDRSFRAIPRGLGNKTAFTPQVARRYQLA